MNFDGAEKIAAAILYEGYILYPYRPTAIKNRQRWNFGTLYPRVYAEALRPQEPFRLIAECLAVADATASLDVRISFLQLVPTKITDELTDPSLAWDEAVERTSEHEGLRLGSLVVAPLTIEMETASPSTALRSGRDDNSVAGSSILAEALPRTTELSSRPERSAVEGPAVQQNLRIELSIGAEILQDGVWKLHLELQNTSPLPSGAGAKREEALPLSFVSAHLLLGITGGEFLSLLDPDPAYREAVAACCNTGVFPVLVGEEPDRSMMFCSPIILYDYPKIAPESEGDFFDGTEMDEMLTLRVLTLTDAEKEEMRSGDPRARRILERTEALTSDSLLKAHGVIRGLREIRGGTQMDPDWNPFEEVAAPPESVRVFGIELRVGDRVRITPKKKADILDMALAGKVAVIEAIEQDFEDHVQLGLVLDDDPGREFGMMRQPGHRFFFSPDEIEPVLKGEPT